MDNVSQTPLKDMTASLSPGFGQGDFTAFGQTPEQQQQAQSMYQTDQINQQLNQAQDTAHAQLAASTSDTSALRSQANDMISTATANVNDVQGQLTAATTGSNDLRTQTQGFYDSLGVAKASDELSAAHAALSQIQAQKADNLTQRENQYAGGGTEDFAHTVNDKDQRLLSLNEIAASIKLQTAQQTYSSKLDAFKIFTGEADSQQSHTINELSQQLSLNKADLQAGVQLLNQARQEEHGDDVAAKNLMISLATSYPGFYKDLSQQDQAAIAQGNVTPTILAKLGTLQTYKDQQQQDKEQQLQIQQERANTQLSKLFGKAIGLGDYLPDGSPVPKALKGIGDVQPYSAKEVAEVNRIIKSNPGEWGKAADTMNSVLKDPTAATRYDGLLKTTYLLPANAREVANHAPKNLTLDQWLTAKQKFINDHSFAPDKAATEFNRFVPKPSSKTQDNKTIQVGQ